jgi:hypothetical protein
MLVRATIRYRALGKAGSTLWWYPARRRGDIAADTAPQTWLPVARALIRLTWERKADARRPHDVTQYRISTWPRDFGNDPCPLRASAPLDRTRPRLVLTAGRYASNQPPYDEGGHTNASHGRLRMARTSV